MMRIVAVIPARGASKGIPRKNLQIVAGHPLLGHIIRTARQVPGIDRVIVSTEDREIADTARDYGAEVPFLRPPELALDEIPTLPVLTHAVHYLEEKENYRVDSIVLLYATSPLLQAPRVSEGIAMMAGGEYDSVVSVEKDWGHFWREQSGTYERFYPLESVNRQYAIPLFRENGALSICTRDLLMERNMIEGGRVGMLVMERGESIDIDDPADLDRVRYILKTRKPPN